MLKKQAVSARKEGWKFLALAYFLYAIFPHAGSVTHVHPGGEVHHDHGYLSVHEAVLSRQILEAYSAEGVVSVSSASISGDETPSAPVAAPAPLENGTQGIGAPVCLPHTHFVQDPNLLALGCILFLAFLISALRLRPVRNFLFVPELFRVFSQARGPPVFS